MKDEERAELVIRMSLPFRAEARTNLDGKLWDRTMEVIRNHSVFGARWGLASVLWRVCGAGREVVCEVWEGMRGAEAGGRAGLGLWLGLGRPHAAVGGYRGAAGGA